MVTAGEQIEPGLSPDNRFYQFRVGFCFGWRKLNLRFSFRLWRPWDFNGTFAAADIPEGDLDLAGRYSDAIDMIECFFDCDLYSVEFASELPPRRVARSPVPRSA